MRGVVSALCALAVLAGCGGDDDETTVVETTTVTTVETVPPPEQDAPVPREPGDDEAADPDAPAGGHGGVTAPEKCGRLAFNPSTDSGASGITAIGTDCQTARAVARAARNATDELRYIAEDFTCTGARSNDAGLSSIEWFCIGADREVVSFVTT